MGSLVVNIIHNVELFKAFIPLSSRPRVAHIIHRLEVLITSGALSTCVDPQFCPPSTCHIRYLFDTLQLAPWWPISTHATYLS